jgi:ABC-type uncharacterized transport system permease subunit
MLSAFVLAPLAALAQLPPAFLAWRGAPAAGGRPPFLAALAVALALPTALVSYGIAGGWPTGLAAALWLAVAAAVLAFLVAALADREAEGLAILLGPYLALLVLLGIAAMAAEPRPLASAVPSAWLVVHVGAALVTYGAVTLAAVAALAILIQERALKTKAPSALSRRLPSVAACERIEIRSLALAAIVLGAGIASGFASAYLSRRGVLPLDHKTVLSLIAFTAIGGILVLRHVSGIRGRAAARWVLAAHLALALAYLGVKFVSQIILGR